MAGRGYGVGPYGVSLYGVTNYVDASAASGAASGSVPGTGVFVLTFSAASAAASGGQAAGLRLAIGEPVASESTTSGSATGVFVVSAEATPEPSYSGALADGLRVAQGLGFAESASAAIITAEKISLGLAATGSQSGAEAVASLRGVLRAVIASSVSGAAPASGAILWSGVEVVADEWIAVPPATKTWQTLGPTGVPI